MTHILITGASGRLGGAAVRSLLALHPAGSVHALVRTPDAAARLRRTGVDARLADYADPAALAAAFRGIDRLLFISSPTLDPEQRLWQHLDVIAASRSIEHIVYTSVHGADHDPAHAATEAALRERGGATILRNGFYTEPFVTTALQHARNGVILSATASRPLATASIADLAEAAARVVAAPPAQDLWELRGPAWTYPGLAAILSGLVGRLVESKEVTPDAVGPLGPLHAVAAAGVLGHETDDLRRLLAREPRGVASVAAAAVHSG